MIRWSALLFVLSSLMAVSLISFPQAPPKSAGQPDRGKYLVEEVARCWWCHSPRDEGGQWDRSRWLRGAPVWFQPVHPVSNWAYQAPNLAGLASFSDEQVLTILTKGVDPNGAQLRQPMHAYHLTQDDAEAVIMYLRSLGRPAAK